MRYVSALLMSLVSLAAPVAPMIVCSVCFIGVDFVTGVMASRSEARHREEKWYFESCEAWRTVRKLALVIVAIAMSWLLECCVLDFVSLNLTKMFTGFVCGVEMWSFLENAAVLSDAALFVWLKKYVSRRIKREIGDE